MKNYWVKEINFKKGTLHGQLGIKKGRKLPEALLRKILKTRAKTLVYQGKKITITPLLKKRVNLALNLRKMKKR